MVQEGVIQWNMVLVAMPCRFLKYWPPSFWSDKRLLIPQPLLKSCSMYKVLTSSLSTPSSRNEISDSDCLLSFRPLDAELSEVQPVDLSSTMRPERIFQINNLRLVSQSLHEI